MSPFTFVKPQNSGESVPLVSVVRTGSSRRRVPPTVKSLRVPVGNPGTHTTTFCPPVCPGETRWFPLDGSDSGLVDEWDTSLGSEVSFPRTPGLLLLFTKGGPVFHR